MNVTINDAPSATVSQPGTDRLVRRSSTFVVVFVGVVAAYVSYRHAFELVHSHGEEGLSAAGGPLTVDGMIIASSMVLLQAARHRIRPPRLAYFALWLGIVATIGANVAHGVGHGWVGALVSAWPAVALIMSFHLLMWIIRRGSTKAAEPDVDQPAPPVDHCGHGVADSADEAVQLAFLHGRDCLSDEPSQRHLERQFGMDRKRVAVVVRKVAPEAWTQTSPELQRAPDPAMNGTGGR